MKAKVRSCKRDAVLRTRSEIPNEVTRQAIRDAKKGRNLFGTFKSVKEMMEALNAS